MKTSTRKYWLRLLKQAETGKERRNLERKIKKYQLEKQVKLIGYRKDIIDLLKISDCFIFPSKQEGLPVALLEAMAAGLPCICSDIRGNRDLGRRGDLFLCSCLEDYIRCMKQMRNCPKKRKEYPILEKYEEEKVKKESERIYRSVLFRTKKSTDIDVYL